MWSAVLSAVVGVHVVAALVAVVFWPYLRKIKDVPWCQRIYGAVRCRLQALTAPLYDPWDAHHIVDNVYLGNLASACNLPRMRDLKVRRVVSVMIGAQEVFPSHFDYHVVHVRDLPEENLLRHLAETTAVISAAVARGEVVYVHCAAGVSRSATVVCAWLMQSRGFTVEQAIEFLRERRAVIRPNAGFVEQLREYGETLK